MADFEQELRKQSKILIEEAIEEDCAKSDITSNTLFADGKIVTGEITAQESGVLAGVKIAEEVFRSIDPELEITVSAADGDRLEDGTLVMRIRGDVRSLFAGERIALNFLQHLSGIATYTSEFVKEAKPSKAEILDTRKTLPGWRYLEKYAVSVGGGVNHRQNLAELLMVKDNHIKAAGGIGKALEKVYAQKPNVKVEVEVETLEELEKALNYPIDVVMLDNMNIPNIMQAVRIVDGRCKIEVSGGVKLQDVKEIAKSGVDYISTSKITFAAPALDLHLEISY